MITHWISDYKLLLLNLKRHPVYVIQTGAPNRGGGVGGGGRNPLNFGWGGG